MLRINTAVLLRDQVCDSEGFESYVEEREEASIQEVDSEAVTDFVADVIDNSDEPETLEPEAVVEVTAELPAEPEWDEAAEHAKDDAAFIGKLRDIGNEIDEAKERIAILTAELKEAKAELKAAEKRLLRTSKEGPQYRKKPEPKPTFDERQAIADGMSAMMDAAVATSDPEPLPNPVDEEWRWIKTETLVQGIERFGAKKQESLIELCPTLGDLVELQKKASLACMPFHEMLPKGIGQGIADELEERIAAKSWKKVE